jgi:hypothetical protein
MALGMSEIEDLLYLWLANDQFAYTYITLNLSDGDELEDYVSQELRTSGTFGNAIIRDLILDRVDWDRLYNQIVDC